MLLGRFYVPLEWVLLFSSSTNNCNIDDFQFFSVPVPADPNAAVRAAAQTAQGHTEHCGDVGSVHATIMAALLKLRLLLLIFQGRNHVFCVFWFVFSFPAELQRSDRTSRAQVETNPNLSLFQPHRPVGTRRSPRLTPESTGYRGNPLFMTNQKD